MSAEMLSGGIQEFDDVVRRGDCPFLNNLGAAALEKMRATFESPTPEDSAEVSLVETRAESDQTPEKTIHEKPTDTKAMDIEKSTLSVALAESPRLENILDEPRVIGSRAGEEPEFIQAQLDPEIREVLFGRAEGMSPATEPEAVAPLVQPDTVQPPRVVTVETVPEPELPIVTVPEIADGGTAQVERPEIEAVELVEPTLGIISAEETESPVSLLEDILTPEAPATIVELLAEPLPELSLELKTEEPLLELGTELDLPFSAQLERLAAETVESERQETVGALLAEIYELLAEPSEELTSLESDVDQAPNEPEIEITPELEQLVAELLQELGVENPEPEQIGRFIALVRAEQRQEAAGKAELITAILPDDDANRSQNFVGAVWTRYEFFLRLHQPLGRMALTQPAA